MSPSKILLFGEYSILVGSDALAIPYTKYSGTFQFIHSGNTILSEAIESNRQLKLFSNYLDNLKNIDQTIDLKRLASDIEKGLYFDSNIPLQYGLGSSGAITAEVLRNYSKIKISDINATNKILAVMESFFHGKSSGIDPLVSYFNSPINVSQGIFNFAEYTNESTTHNISIFIIDTQMVSKTKGAVEKFLFDYKNNVNFRQIIDSNYVPLVNKAIEHLLLKDSNQFLSVISQLSSMQIAYFKHLIPDKFLRIVKDGISNQLYFLKLCGSGGGGFLLGFTEKPLETKEYFLKENIKTAFINSSAYF